MPAAHEDADAGSLHLRLRQTEPGVATATIRRVHDEVGAGAPSEWTFDCDVLQPGMFNAYFQSAPATFLISHLLADPTDPQVRMPAAALMLERQGKFELLPDADLNLKPGDRILFVGDSSTRRLQRRYLTEPGTVSWTLSGTEPPRSFVFRWWHRRSRGAV